MFGRIQSRIFAIAFPCSDTTRPLISRSESRSQGSVLFQARSWCSREQLRNKRTLSLRTTMANYSLLTNDVKNSSDRVKRCALHQSTFSQQAREGTEETPPLWDARGSSTDCAQSKAAAPAALQWQMTRLALQRERTVQHRHAQISAYQRCRASVRWMPARDSQHRCSSSQSAVKGTMRIIELQPGAVLTSTCSNNSFWNLSIRCRNARWTPDNSNNQT
jgi:hypothetical protein